MTTPGEDWAGVNDKGRNCHCPTGHCVLIDVRGPTPHGRGREDRIESCKDEGTWFPEKGSMRRVT